MPVLQWLEWHVVDRPANMHQNALIFVVPAVALLTPWMQNSFKIVENHRWQHVMCRRSCPPRGGLIRSACLHKGIDASRFFGTEQFCLRAIDRRSPWPGRLRCSPFSGSSPASCCCCRPPRSTASIGLEMHVGTKFSRISAEGCRNWNAVP